MLPHKPGVMVGWTLDLLLARDIEQMITLHDVEALSDLAARLRSSASQPPSITASVSEAAAIREQL
jgi:hypothetical protein